MNRKILSLFYSPYLNANIQTIFRPIEEHKREIVKYLEKAPYRTALDFGCGEGLFCDVFENKKYLGYDKDIKKIEYAKRKYREYSFSSTALESFAEIDLFVFINVLHHMPEKDVKEVFGKIAAESGKGARIIILEVIPVKKQRSKITKMLMKIEEKIQGSSWKEAEDWARCAGPDEFAVRKVEDIGSFYIVDMELKEKGQQGRGDRQG